MEFLVTAYDDTDREAPARRLASRAAHLDLGDKMIADGSLLYAAAILDDGEKMIGSSMVVRFSNRAELDAWLKNEPYMTGAVWKNVTIQRCRSGPSFVR